MAKKRSDGEKKRKPIPITTKRELLLQSCYRCGCPGCPTLLVLEMLEDHHIKYVSEDGGNELANLLPLCPNHHTLHHKGKISQEAIRLWKGLLLCLNASFDRASMDALIFLHKMKDNQTPLWFTPDSVLRFAGLIGAGLVEIGQQVQATPMQIPESRHQIKLTLEGAMFVEAWITGDEEKYRGYLNK
jgi:hypothetical protein